jgi:hypothetical protein
VTSMLSTQSPPMMSSPVRHGVDEDDVVADLLESLGKVGHRVAVADDLGVGVGDEVVCRSAEGVAGRLPVGVAVADDDGACGLLFEPGGHIAVHPLAPVVVRGRPVGAEHDQAGEGAAVGGGDAQGSIGRRCGGDEGFAEVIGVRIADEIDPVAAGCVVPCAVATGPHGLEQG